MGLDIYFHKCKRANWERYNELTNEYHDKYDALDPDEAYEKGKGLLEEMYNQVGTSDKEIGYFRKVNFLMEFFKYKGNCDYVEITREQLEELQDRCTRIAAQQGEGEEFNEDDVALAKELLPTQGGFFFGSTDYDKWYFQDVKEVLTWVNGVLDAIEDDEVVLMYAWW